MLEGVREFLVAAFVIFEAFPEQIGGLRFPVISQFVRERLYLRRVLPIVFKRVVEYQSRLVPLMVVFVTVRVTVRMAVLGAAALTVVFVVVLAAVRVAVLVIVFVVMRVTLGMTVFATVLMVVRDTAAVLVAVFIASVLVHATALAAGTVLVAVISSYIVHRVAPFRQLKARRISKFRIGFTKMH
jgi:hypothetical protein